MPLRTTVMLVQQSQEKKFVQIIEVLSLEKTDVVNNLKEEQIIKHDPIREEAWPDVHRGINY